MGQQQSKEELLFQQVNYGNVEGIKSLRSEGAGLEWIDKEGKTPLIAACMNPELYNVAKTLIELGANVNAYRPGRHAGTPLHHAAKRGLEPTVKLLLSHGANALVMNDDCQTPLDVARVKGYSNVARAIESHICLFSGWMRELYGPDFLELLAPQLLTRKVWVVVLPCGSRNLRKPFKLELAIYASEQDAQPRTTVALWKANLEEPKLNQADPAVVISDIATKARIKLAPAREGDKQQLQSFCNACKGIPQVIHSAFPFNPQVPAVEATAPLNSEDSELAMAISASLQSAAQERPQYLVAHIDSRGDASTSWADSAGFPGNNGSCGLDFTSQSGISSVSEVQEADSSNSLIRHIQTPTVENPALASIPSAPPVADAIMGDVDPIHYPSVDSGPVVFSSNIETAATGSEGWKEEKGTSSSCVVCLDAPVEAACVPCGHMAGCLSCLNEIKGKKWGCPVCRAKIDQVIRLYAV